MKNKTIIIDKINLSKKMKTYKPLDPVTWSLSQIRVSSKSMTTTLVLPNNNTIRTHQTTNSNHPIITSTIVAITTFISPKPLTIIVVTHQDILTIDKINPISIPITILITITMSTKIVAKLVIAQEWIMNFITIIWEGWIELSYRYYKWKNSSKCTTSTPSSHKPYNHKPLIKSSCINFLL